MRVSGYGTIMKYKELEDIFNSTIGKYTFNNWCFDMDDWEWVGADPLLYFKRSLEWDGYIVEDIWVDPDGVNAIIDGKKYWFDITAVDLFDLDEDSVKGAVIYEFNSFLEGE